jgi:hypothetical protein
MREVFLINADVAAVALGGLLINFASPRAQEL